VPANRKGAVVKRQKREGKIETNSRNIGYAFGRMQKVLVAIAGLDLGKGESGAG
jgi:hypothetical protein